jgi:hypothetical protein
LFVAFTIHTSILALGCSAFDPQKGDLRVVCSADAAGSSSADGGCAAAGDAGK